MLAVIQKSQLFGEIIIPGSKSHMIRALYFGTLAEGKSVIKNPVESNDALSCLNICEALGAEIDRNNSESWIVNGVGKKLKPSEYILDVGNSGTTLYLGAGFASSIDGYSIFTGDEQIRRRPIQPVLDSLKKLGVFAESTRNNGSAPVIIKGPIKFGKTVINGLVSAYVSGIVLGCTLSPIDCEVEVENVREIPYINISLDWAKTVGLQIDASEDRSKFFIKGNQSVSPFKRAIPGDFSSAAFILIGAAITESEVTLMGLDMNDVQGDKKIISILQEMGANIEILNDGIDGIKIKGGSKLKGTIIDCNEIPDSIPILSILGCCAEGETRLINIESSRVKESDRPLLMTHELSKMGADIKLEKDELVIKKSKLKGAFLNSYKDHRIAMANCIAGLVAEGATIVDDVETAGVSFPGFENTLKVLGANTSFVQDIL